MYRCAGQHRGAGFVCQIPLVGCAGTGIAGRNRSHCAPLRAGSFKARDISACMRMLRDEFGGHVPDTMEQLLRLPGVGRKSANLVMGDVFGKPAIVTDTHCIRLCNRIGLVDGIKDPAKVEKALWKIIPPEEGSDFCHRLVYHGRAVCDARKPNCAVCCLKDVCAESSRASVADEKRLNYGKGTWLVNPAGMDRSLGLSAAKAMKSIAMIPILFCDLLRRFSVPVAVCWKFFL